MTVVSRPTPAVSVVIPVYNGARFLPEAINSILEQSLTALELVIIDDGSTDATGRILAEYVARDSRVRVIGQANAGRASALNRGFAAARAGLVARLDADDVALVDRLERQRAFMESRPEVAVVGGAVSFVDEELRVIGTAQYPLHDTEIREALSTSTPLAHPAVMIKGSAFRQAGGYRTLFRVAEDTDLWLRIAEYGELANLPDAVIRYRMHTGQDSVRSHELATFEALAARVSARERACGRPDPLSGLRCIDADALRAIGVDDSELTAALVRDASWLARTMARAGRDALAGELFAVAEAHARSDSGSRALQAEVRSARVRHHTESGRRLAAGADRVLAAWLRRRS